MKTTTRMLETLAKIVSRASRSSGDDCRRVCHVPTALLEEARDLMELHRVECEAQIASQIKHASNRVF